MMTTSMISTAATTDAELVNGTLSGDRDAFTQIVSRYQSLICSLTYSATGSLGQSEDLAQETFITAWKHLRQLREREKLRSWLCGIARNRINNFLRREGREPSHRAEPLEEISERHSPEPLPFEYTISKEEEQILWRSLERIPEIYREPLVLFYREHQSVEAVAEKLELTEETVHQRLSRGRKLLQEQVLAFVEGALARTNPAQAFTLSVLSALPAAGFSTKAATLGAALKGGAGAKAMGVMGWFSAIFTPLLVIFGNYASYKMSMDEAQSDTERHHVKRIFRSGFYATLVLSAILAVPLGIWAWQRQQSIGSFIGLWFPAAVVIYFLTMLAFVVSSFAGWKMYLRKTLAEQYHGQFPPSAYEYRSRASLFGLPLIHVRIGDRFDVIRPPVKAWIAIGSSYAVGGIFASGNIAVAPISFGGVAIGLFSFGAIGIGAVTISAIGMGVWAYGALAFGWQIVCGCGAALQAADGGIVFAGGFADGIMAHAAFVNDAYVRGFFQQSPFFRIANVISRYNLWLLYVIPMFLQSRIVSKARRRREPANG